MKKPVLLRQGDVLLIPMESMPAGQLSSVERENGRIVLAHGEITGHAHAIVDESAELVTAEQAAELYLLVHGTEGVDLVHEEHDTIRVPGAADGGTVAYEVRRQREYAPEAIRMVAD